MTGELLALILPPGIECEEHIGPAAGHVLLSEEEYVIAGAGEQRRSEFAAVRSCARTCLVRLGYPQVAIVPGPGGAPRWPSGVRGSMTHCHGYAAAALGPDDLLAGIGIDAEPDVPLPDGVLDVVATPAERRRLAAAPSRLGEPHWDTLLFSAKEAVYKLWFPVMSAWLDPQEADVAFAPAAIGESAQGTFTVALHKTLVVDGRRLTDVRGRWARQHGILVTSVVLPAFVAKPAVHLATGASFTGRV